MWGRNILARICCITMFNVFAYNKMIRNYRNGMTINKSTQEDCTLLFLVSDWSQDSTQYFLPAKNIMIYFTQKVNSAYGDPTFTFLQII